MPTPRKRTQKPKSKDQPAPLKGWQQIAAFLGQPVSVAQRWTKTGMPFARQGRFVVASPEELNKWLGRESGEPLHVATEEADLSSELKRGLAWYAIMRCVRVPELGTRCKVLTWQELSAALRSDLRQFLDFKYGIVPTMCRPSQLATLDL